MIYYGEHCQVCGQSADSAVHLLTSLHPRCHPYEQASGPCLVCGGERDDECHVREQQNPEFHQYAPGLSGFPRAETLKAHTLSLLTVEERKTVQWIKDFWEDPEAHGGLATLQDSGFAIIDDLLGFLARYAARDLYIESVSFGSGSDRVCD